MKVLEKVNWKKVLRIAIPVLSGLLLVYLGFSLYFLNHFPFRTTINGVNASFKSPAKVEELIKEQIGGYELVLEERDGATEKITSTDIGLTAEFNGSVKKELSKHSCFAWIGSLFHNTNVEIDGLVTYDEAKFETMLAGLSCMNTENFKDPVDATISEYEEGSGFSIVPEQEGTTIDELTFRAALHEAITNLCDTLSLADSNSYVSPKHRADSEEMVSLCDQMNELTKAQITYEAGSKKVVLDGAKIETLLTISEDYTATLDDTKAAEFVATLADTFDTAHRNRVFQTSYGASVTLPASKNEYGWQVDQSGELAKLKEDIATGESVTREPVYAQTANSHGENDFGGTYAEVNLTAQHMYFYKDGKLVVESDFVSGNLAKGYDTPIGAYGVTYTQKDRILRGDGYASPVSFWMPFNGGIGFHDATWRSDFGGNYYKTSGSHGCINMPYSKAKALFENIKAGDAVIVYELAGTENEKGKAQDAAKAVRSQIDAIGTVTLDSQTAISTARTAYDALSDQAKGYVSNYSTLTEAETRYQELVSAKEQEEKTKAEQAQKQQDAAQTGNEETKTGE